jgi:hypothetical protein
LDTASAQPFPVRDAAGLIGAALDLFMRNLSAFAWTSIAPALAISVLDIALGEQEWVVRLLLAVPLLFIELLIWSATTLVSVGAVLGHVPDVGTAYRCALRSPLGTLLKSTLLMAAMIIGGTFLLIIPGLIMLAQTVLVPAIVVVERRATWDSLRRSRALGAGFYVRNLLIVIVLYLPSILGAIFASSLDESSAVFDVALALLSTVLQTLSMLATVLVYIDMRTRKEGLDPNTLSLEINAAYGDRA